MTEAAPDPVQALRDGRYDRPTLTRALALRGAGQARLFELARARRSVAFPSGQVEVRSVLEVGNVCMQRCLFCAIPAAAGVSAFLPDPDETLQIVSDLYARGRRVVMLQSGELKAKRFVDAVTRAVAAIKERFGDLELILCLGSLSRPSYRRLREAGADRYILKFEASRAALYERIKPTETFAERLRCLDDLVELGFDVGTGNITGLPGQSVDDLVDDLLFIAERHDRLTMASTSLFIPGPGSAYEHEAMGDLDLALNVMALIRIGSPGLLIPTTSSLERARVGGQKEGLLAGANTVTVHDGTPEDKKGRFPIYSRKRYAPSERGLFEIVAEAGLQLPPEARREHVG